MKSILSEGVTLHCIQDSRFKDIAVVIDFLCELDEKNATVRSLLALMLSDRCAKYDTKEKMTKVSDELYGATLTSRTLGCGKGHILEIRSKIINPIYVKESNNLLRDQLCLLREVIFNPLLKDKNFSLELFEEAKYLLKSKIQRRMDDAQSFSVSQCLKHGGEDTALAIPSIGTLEMLEKIELIDVMESYQHMLSKEKIDIMVCGEFDSLQIEKLIREILPFEVKPGEPETHYVIDKQASDQVDVERREIPQTNIAVLWECGIDALDPLYPALKVANGIFGGQSTSLLFQNIREKHSLCYSIFTNLISFDGAMILSTGIEHTNIEKTLQLIDEQLEKCRNGEYDDELIVTTKRMLINGLKAGMDSMNGVLSYTYNNCLLNREYSIDENIEQIKKVSREDLNSVFEKMKKLNTFVLTGVDSNE